MASATLYPPVISSYLPAFLPTETCRVYFNLSKLSLTDASQIKSVHISIMNQRSGLSVVKKENNAQQLRWRTAGIIVQDVVGNMPYDEDKKSYYIEITKNDLVGNEWTPGWTYKIQIRVSTEAFSENSKYYGTDLFKMADWLNDYARYFSEWSTVCLTKVIPQPIILVPIFDFDSSVTNESTNINKIHNLVESTIDFTAIYNSTDPKETLYSYQVKLLSPEDKILEDSGLLYPDEYDNTNQMNYIFHKELENQFQGKIQLDYCTSSEYHKSYTFNFIITHALEVTTDIHLKPLSDIIGGTPYEQEEGCLGLRFTRLYNTEPFSGNLCIRRASSRDNFAHWDDIKIIGIRDAFMDDMPIYYDFTVESGVYYKYGVQLYEKKSYGITRGVANITEPMMVEFENSYLLGAGGQQLKLNLNYQMPNYRYNIMDMKMDTIGNKYPFISRTANVQYRSFPMNGHISYNMDDQHLFLPQNFYFTKKEIPTQIVEYDYTYEREFREKVIHFLQDGKPKLYKSPSEGNILVRLMDVSTTPDKSTNRLISTFSANAHEIGEPTIQNLSSWGMIEMGEGLEDFSITKAKPGQIIAAFKPGDNIFDYIKQKYDIDGNQAGFKFTIESISGLEIIFDKGTLIYNDKGQKMLGNQFQYNGQTITVNSKFANNIYQFDPDMVFDLNSSIIVKNNTDPENAQELIPATINFVYRQKKETFKDREIVSQETARGIGQIFKTFKPNDNVYRDLEYKYYYDFGTQARKLDRLVCTAIEAPPNAVFELTDAQDATGERHIIGPTGYLNISTITDITDIKYLGMIQADGSLNKNKKADVVVDYIYYTYMGNYQ